MKSSLATLPESSPVWIFYTSRPFSTSDRDACSVYLSEFIRTWASHGTELSSTFEWYHNQILVVAVDAHVHAASGCSIDKLLHAIRQIDEQWQSDFLDRSKLLVRCKDNSFEVFTLAKAGQWVACNSHRVQCIVQSHLSTLGAWKNEGMVSLKDSWLKKYMTEPVSG